MPYDGEFAGYRALQRIAETERVQQLLRRAQVYTPGASGPAIEPSTPPTTEEPLPEFIVAIDGSSQEVSVKTGYPGAKIGYLTVASVLLDLSAIDSLDAMRPADPVAFRKTEEAATIDAALPGSNVVTRTHRSAKVAFREELYEIFHNEVVDTQDRVPLLDTYEALLALKPTTRPQSCPYPELGCEKSFVIGPGTLYMLVREAIVHLVDGTLFASTSDSMIWARTVRHLVKSCRSGRESCWYIYSVLSSGEGFLHKHIALLFVDGPLALFGHPCLAFSGNLC